MAVFSLMMLVTFSIMAFSSLFKGKIAHTRGIILNLFYTVLVTGKERFKYAEQELPQPYALVITFTYSGQEDIKLYDKLQNNVRIRDRKRERARAQVRR